MARRNSDSCVDLMHIGELDTLSRRNSESINDNHLSNSTNKSGGISSSFFSSYSRSLSLHYLHYHGSRKSSIKHTSKEADMEEAEEGEGKYVPVGYNSMSRWKFIQTIKSLLNHVSRNRNIAPSSSSSSNVPPHKNPHVYNPKKNSQINGRKKERRNHMSIQRNRGSSGGGDSMSNMVVTGTLYGRRRGRISLVLQQAQSPSPGSASAHNNKKRAAEPVSVIVVVELPMQTSALLREMATGLVKIALECNRSVSMPEPNQNNSNNNAVVVQRPANLKADSPAIGTGNVMNHHHRHYHHHRISDVAPKESAGATKSQLDMEAQALGLVQGQSQWSNSGQQNVDYHGDSRFSQSNGACTRSRGHRRRLRPCPSENHCDLQSNSSAIDLLCEPSWTMHCNGRKVGFAVRRSGGPSATDLHILSLLLGVSTGAGILPATISPPPSTTSSSCHTNSTPIHNPNPASASGIGLLADDSHILYLRSSFQRVIGSSDSQAFYMINPDHGFASGPDLSIFFHRSTS